MSSFQIENHSNDTVDVAVAYNHYNGNLIAEGWWQVQPNQAQTFSAQDAADFYLRVQSRNGDDVTFSNFNSFLSWTIPQARFTLSREADDSAVQVLRWGSNLENTLNKAVDQPFPAGWSSLRFFRVGPGDYTARIESPASQQRDGPWLDDNELARLSRQFPSTAFGAQLMRDVWPQRYPGLLSSDTYRGCAIALSMLCASMRKGISIHEIERVIDGVDQAIKTSRTFPAGSDQCGGALLTTTNAWTCAQCGYTAAQIAAAYESELIYVARMFVAARQQGL